MSPHRDELPPGTKQGAARAALDVQHLELNYIRNLVHVNQIGTRATT
jgi:hypothetical protein